jgi:hypothetical protein
MVLTIFLDTADFDFQLTIFGMSLAWVGVVLWVAVTVSQIISGLSGPVVALFAVARDRSLLVWVAMVPGVIVLSGLATLEISTMIGPGELPLRYGLPIGVLLWAVLVISIISNTRTARPFGEEVLMTAQHAPQTPPLWRRFLSLPRTRQGWWAIGLASSALIAFVTLNFIDPEHTVSPPWLGAELAALSSITVLVGALGGGVVGSLALGAGDRSLLVWLAQVPVALLFVGKFSSIFQENPLWVGLSVGVLFWALIASVIAFSILYLRSQGVHRGRSGAIGSRGRSS